MRQANERNAAVIGNPALLGLDDFGDFGVVDVERLQRLNGGKAEPRLVQRDGIGGHHAMASRNAKQSQSERRQERARAAIAWWL